MFDLVVASTWSVVLRLLVPLDLGACLNGLGGFAPRCFLFFFFFFRISFQDLCLD